MALEQQLLDKLDKLIDAFKEASKPSSRNIKQASSSNSNKLDYDSERAIYYNQLLRQTREETEQIRNNIFGYETVYKRIIRLEKEKANLEKDISSNKYKGNQLIQKELQLAQKINEIERENAKLKIDGYTKLDEEHAKWEKRSNAFKKGISEIKQGFNDAVKSVKGFTDS